MTITPHDANTVEQLEQLAPSLADVLERFNESSSKLEARHQELMREVEELRERLRAKDEEVKRAERLAMLGLTAAGLAHEIRNPLGAITLFVSMLKNDLSDRPESLQLVEQIESGIRSLDGVVSNVLHFAQNKPLRVAPMNLHSVVQELHHHFSSLYSPQSCFEVRLSGNPFIKGDEQGVRQCLYNIIINALQAVSFAGTICISVSDQPESGMVSIVIEDDGPGVPSAILDRLFEPFTSGRREGTGLGLSIVRRIVEAHGGAVGVENTPHARFSIHLPRNAGTDNQGV
jgi:two-component system sensor histidine kinase AtoS